MKCPACPDTVLVMSERQGVEIDYCPQCRGVWLDRGELDKLLERSASMPPAAAPSQPHFADAGREYARGRHSGRKESWLDEIFD
ncbi:zf-TFIIB domain-containing protein [Mitsuaria sp. WAJ17]|uniref:TFIIB-type zinc ribbon-containing protein n=1 Tax=Mitsuaria sp. WAJ17 TaxID=2761452 RepID=UPI001603B58B|nr:zf-TFIIB domain-containing protein [Mitsuaria sp. WAJ17]MBB2486360.1 zf-TFIIB domain-containing protein [Mitsuaria sp. WAJ17]